MAGYVSVGESAYWFDWIRMVMVPMRNDIRRSHG